jgi:hypothetical protein
VAGQNKPSTTKPINESEPKPTTPQDALNRTADAVETAANAGEVVTLGAAKGLANVANKADDISVARSAASGSLNALGVNTAFEIVGKAAGFVDAGMAVYEAYNTINDPNATASQKAGAVAKAAVKTVLSFMRINPVIGIGMGILDLTGATDALFNWKW